jgi:hypothetical protein
MIARLTSRAMAAGQLLEPSLSTRLRESPGSLMRTSRGFLHQQIAPAQRTVEKTGRTKPSGLVSTPVLSAGFAFGQAEALVGDYLSGESTRYR